MYFPGQISSSFAISEEHFNPALRKDGLSGFMRLRNEQDFLAPVIESHLPFLDELIIVFNRCTDHTPRIVEEYAQRYPQKIKAFDYPYPVSPQGSDKHVTTSPISPESLVYYYNFALSRTTFRHAFKVDGDHILIPQVFAQIAAYIRQEKPQGFLRIAGINLWDDDQGRICVPKGGEFCGRHGDFGIFPVSRNTRFLHHQQYEVFTHGLPAADCGIGFFHLKHMKLDRGAANYDLAENPESPYIGALNYLNGLAAPPLLDWEEFKALHEIPSHIPHPAALGIRTLRRGDSPFFKDT